MLTEQFVASIAAPTKAVATSLPQDAAIFVQELQPLPAQRQLFKKSVTARNSLAVNESHIFAAQHGKAQVHVYSRERGNHEATVSFQERISCLVLAAGGTVLILGTEGGSIILWEICTGRSIIAPQAHLQPVTSIAVDPSSNHFLSGSEDSIVHVWSLFSFLTFDSSSSSQTVHTPIRTLSNHRSAIRSLVTGHSTSRANIAVSASDDNTAIVWDYHLGRILRTYLLGSPPTSLALDAADRALIATFPNGSVQVLDFYAESHRAISDLYEVTENAPILPPPEGRYHAQDLGAAHCVALSWDSSTILTGHESGKIALWDIGRGFRSIISTLPGPVTNLVMQAPTGFSNSSRNDSKIKIKIDKITKPQYGVSSQTTDSSGNGRVPPNYTITAQLRGHLPPSSPSLFTTALTHPSFPSQLLDEAIASLSATTPSQPTSDHQSDFLAFSEDTDGDSFGRETPLQSLQTENKVLRARLFKALDMLGERWEAGDAVKGLGGETGKWEEGRRRYRCG
ncbi:WD40 repeat-like protein [Aulographum hederae CBS 113979]|uniref:Pre-rRNA-processing protein IPI3 n=1 Tax=Aulographum hederae CBS 113979 TaxID=1176131 RepID=A0A6G1GS96_9PEZI|nr:WD40 repeat-like protein [Aulographum hederae CBS 113979]